MSDDPTPEEESAWVQDERSRVIGYLINERLEHGGVGEWPAFHLFPYLAIWAIQSKKRRGAIGWWAISGDLPTDYMSNVDANHPRKAMAHFSREWAEVSDYMARGQKHPRTKIGTPKEWPTLAPLLRTRSELLRDFVANDVLWEEHEEERG